MYMVFPSAVEWLCLEVGALHRVNLNVPFPVGKFSKKDYCGCKFILRKNIQILLVFSLFSTFLP